MRSAYCRLVLSVRSLADRADLLRFFWILIANGVALAIGIVIAELADMPLDQTLNLVGLTVTVATAAGMLAMYVPGDDALQRALSPFNRQGRNSQFANQSSTNGDVGVTVVNQTAYPVLARLVGGTELSLVAPRRGQAVFLDVAPGRCFLRFRFEVPGDPLYCQSRAIMIKVGESMTLTLDRLLGGSLDLIVIDPANFENGQELSDIDDVVLSTA